MATTTETAVTDVRAAHREALMSLEACQTRVRDLTRVQLHEETQLFDQRRTLKLLRPDGTTAAPGERGAWGVITSHDVTGSRIVPRVVDPLEAMEARLAMPSAIMALRHAEVAESRLRGQVEAVDVEEKRQAKLKLLPKVATAYRKLDALLVKASDAREEVRQALAEIGTVSPAEVNAMAGITWPELGFLEARREIVRSWTAQTNGSGT
jgi:hypothetical protein